MTSSGRSPSSASGLQAALIRFAIRFRGVVVALAVVLLGYGVLSVMRAKYDVFPEFAPPQVSIQTEARRTDPGANRSSGHPTDRERDQRRARGSDPAIIIRPRTFRRSPVNLRSGKRHLP